MAYFSDVERLLLIVLWGAWAVQLFGGFLFFAQENAEQTHRIPTRLRMGSSAALVVLAWLAFFFTQSTFGHALPFWLALGMTLGFLGDLFMARLIIQHENYLLAGMGAFGLGHVCYVVGLLSYGDTLALTWTAPFVVALLGWFAVALGCWFAVVFYKNAVTIIHLAALPYTALLATTPAVATGLALQSALFIWLALGGALFLLSDLLLAAQLFRKLHFRSIGDVIWFAYGTGQMLIVCGLWLAL